MSQRDDFSAGWQGGTMETNVHKTGGQARRLSPKDKGSEYTEKTLEPAWNLDNSILQFWVYVEAPQLAGLDKLSVFVGEGKDSLYVESFGNKYLISGWNRMSVTLKRMISHGSATSTSLSKTTLVRIQATALSGLSTSVVVSDLEAVPVINPQGALIISFDDAVDNVYTHAYPVMRQDRVAGVAYVPTTYVGQKGRMTIDQLTAMQDQGWDIAAHGYHHVDGTSLSPTQLDQEYQSAQAWLKEHGFKAYRHIAYPFGMFNSDTYRIAEKYWDTGRTTKWDPRQWETFPPADRLLLRSMNVPGDETLTTTQSSIAEAMDSGQLMILVFHSIADVVRTPETEYPADRFKQLVDWIAAKGYRVTTLTQLKPDFTGVVTPPPSH